VVLVEDGYFLGFPDSVLWTNVDWFGLGTPESLKAFLYALTLHHQFGGTSRRLVPLKRF
jgi:hypothetical protein